MTACTALPSIADFPRRPMRGDKAAQQDIEDDGEENPAA